VTFSHHQVQE